MSAGVASASLASQPTQTWGTDGRVDAVLPVADGVVIAGSFTSVVDPSGKSVPAANIAKLDANGVFDGSWQASTNGPVTGLASDGQRLFVVGRFGKVDDQRQAKMAAVSLSTGALDSAWDASANAPVDAVTLAGSSVYVSGRFTAITDAAGSHARSYVAKLDAATGALDTAWTPSPDARTRALAASPDGSNIFLGGDFTNVDGISGTRVTAEVAATGSGALTAFRGSATNGNRFDSVIDLATDGTDLYVAAGGSGGGCTAMRASDGSQVWSHHGNGNVQAVAASNGTVYCGGHFSGSGSIDGTLDRNKLVAVDAASGAVTDFAPTVNSALGVWALAADPNRLFVGGDFTKVAGTAVHHFTEFVEGTAQTVPGAPTLSATADAGVVHLSWTPPAADGGSPILRYKVYRTTDGSYGRPLAVVRDGTAYDDTTVSNGVAYSYEVTAVSALGEGSPSTPVTVTPQPTGQTVPGAPIGLTAGAASNSVTLSWHAPTDTGNSPITGYQIYRGTASGQETLLATPTGTGTTYVDTAVTSGTAYYYAVRAVNAVGTGPASAEASTSAATPTRPGAPTLSATVTNGTVQLSWTPPASDGGSPIIKWVVVRDGHRLVTVKSTLSYVDTTVTNGMSYTYQVRAVNAVGAGKYSNKVTVRVQ